MDTVSVTRDFDAAPAAVRDAMTDVEPFMLAAGFDRVTVEDDTIHVTNQVGIAEIELVLDIDDDPNSDFAYSQREGIFEQMSTVYTVTDTDDGTEVTATTEFALDVALVGSVLDSTIIKRQRRRELQAQFDWLERRA
jgi:hypothetical protein